MARSLCGCLTVLFMQVADLESMAARGENETSDWRLLHIAVLYHSMIGVTDCSHAIGCASMGLSLCLVGLREYSATACQDQERSLGVPKRAYRRTKCVASDL